MANLTLLNLSYHSTGKFATGPPSRAINMRTRITQRGRDASEQRCAYACRCPEGVAAPLGCVILVRMLIALLGGPVANFPALWYDKFNKLESVMH